MKINEIHRTGTTDNEELGSHGRTLARFNYEVSFAHESGLEAAFVELLKNDQFRAELEVAFTAKFREAAQKMVRSSTIPPGHGWMDDLEADVILDDVEQQQIT